MKGGIKNLSKNLFFILAIFLAVSALFTIFGRPLNTTNEIALTQLVEEVNQSKVEKIIIIGNKLIVNYREGEEAQSRKESETSLDQALLNYGVNQDQLRQINIEVQEEKDSSAWLVPLMITIVPLLLFGVFFWMIFRQAKAGSSQALNFSKARVRLFGAGGKTKEKVTFKDVAGLKETKEELQEIVAFLKNPQKFLNMGARIPRGVILLGPPGVGKTLLARAVAGESKVPFFHISGSEFVEMFVGVGASRVRDLFGTAKKNAPCILFIDELDAVGRHRGAGLGGGHDEREQTLNQILVEMDGFDRDTNVIVMAATNRPDVLDPALLRPGRFDRRAVLDLPDINDREAILKIHAKGKPLALDVNLREIAERTPGFSGADLANLINEAAILAARKNKTQIYQGELLESIERVLLGPERRSHILSDKEKKVAAYHEAGHALLAHMLSMSETVRKVSIVARGRAAGYTLKLPNHERQLKNLSVFKEELAVLLGGYTAEKLIFQEVTTGSANDLDQASTLARRLVKEYGMSEDLGPIVFGEKEEMIFLGKEIGEQRNYSEEVAAKIDKEISKLIKEARKTAETMLRKNKALLDKIAKVLIERETIEKEEFEKLLGKGKTEKKSPAQSKPKKVEKKISKQPSKDKSFRIKTVT